MNSEAIRGKEIKLTLLFSILALFSLIGIVLSALLISTDTASGKIPVTIRQWVSSGEDRRTALELTGRDDSFQPFEEDRIFAEANYVYLFLELTNQTNRHQELILHNFGSNYYTELLKPAQQGAITLARHGDIVPLSESPVRYRRAAFSISLEPGEKRELLLEYHGPRGIAVAPHLSNPLSFFHRLSAEHSRTALLYGFGLALLLFLAGSGFFLKKSYFFAAALFLGSIFFFSLRQSRILLHLIDPYTYPEWLFPLSISFNLLSAIVFGKVLLNPWLGKGGVLFLRVAVLVILLMTLLSFFILPYEFADGLNLLTFAILLFLITRLYRGIREGSIQLLWLLLSFAPWILVMVTDILFGYINFRIVQFEEDQHMLGLLSSLILLTILFLLRYRREAIPGVMEKSGSPGLTNLTTLRNTIINDLGSRISFPLETIAAAGKIVERYRKDISLSAAGRVITKEVERLRDTIETGIARYEEEKPLMVDEKLLLSRAEDANFGKIRIFDPHGEDALRLALMLQADHFSVSIESDYYQVLKGAAQGQIDVLLLSATGAGDRAIQLCRLVRGEYNMMELPIMMVLKQGRGDLVEKAYAAGVNDMLTLPFKERELMIRMASLVKLREITHHNRDLSQSEKEKNVFLYFLTHNVNTPLTILINRVQELEHLLSLDELPEIVEDLQASSQEISDIVRNVLISFRLADGRHTLFMEDIDPRPIFSSLEKEMQKKAGGKKQHLYFSVPKTAIQVRTDTTAFKGVLYNLIDNAIKYTPVEGEIEVKVLIGNHLSVEVRDNGPGIPESERHLLFRRFESLSTTPSGGESSTGLGLFVARELTRMSGGNLELIGSDSGAVFLLTVPLTAPHSQPVDQGAGDE